MLKKAQGISINTIIVAAIALIVLVVLVVIFTGRMGQWGISTKDCVLQGGRCAPECGSVDYGTEDYPIEYTAWECKDEGDICCIKGG